jgi:hypothetical protein
MLPKSGIGSEFGLCGRGGYRLNLSNSITTDGFSNALFATNGRAAIGLVARHARQITDPKRDTVLVPAYLCPTMIQPILELGMKVAFYPVGSDLCVDPAAICERVDDHTLAVMLMHYFGFPQPADIAGILAAEFPHILVIDDRTHMLLTDLSIGSTTPTNTAAIYSARKWGPFPDLGIVLWPGENPPERARGYDWGFGVTRLVDVLLRALFCFWSIEELRKLSLKAYHRAEHILDQRVQIHHASLISRVLWRHWDWMFVYQARRENYQYLLDNWPSEEIRPLFETLPECVCPLGFPVLSGERDEHRRHLIEAGIYPPVHWPRPAQLSPGDFPNIDAIVAQELTIPIDQRYCTDNMDHILEAISCCE